MENLGIIDISGASADSHNPRLIALEAAIFGFPLVLMDVVRRAHPRTANLFFELPRRATAIAPGFADHDVRVGRFGAWLDLREGPVVLSVPDMLGRHFVTSLIDARGETFRTLGSRTRRGSGFDFTLVGPDWRGEFANGTEGQRATSNHVWAVTHIIANCASDRAAVSALGAAQMIVPVGRAKPTATEMSAAFRPTDTSPVNRVMRMGAAAFLHRLAAALSEYPLNEQEMEIARRLRVFGLRTEQTFGDGALAPGLLEAMESGVECGKRLIWRTMHKASMAPWRRIQSPPVRGGEDPLARAVAAACALGGPLAEDVLTFVTQNDDHDRSLTGAHAYQIRFAPGETPPVDGAWTLALTGRPGSAMCRYAIGSHGALEYERDGSLILSLQSRPPPPRRITNWLPIPRGPFSLTMHIHRAHHKALSGAWTMPAVKDLGVLDEHQRRPVRVGAEAHG